MKYRKTYFIISLCIILSVMLLCSCSRVKQYTAYNLELFDTVSSITGYADSQGEFDEVTETAFAELGEYNRLYDIYNDYDGINNIKTINDSAGKAPVKVDERIIDLLIFAKEVCRDTDGRVNAALGPVLLLWHEARDYSLEHPEDAYIPDMNSLKKAAEHTDMDKVIIDENASTVYLEDKDMRLDVGALAKGYALECVSGHMPDGYLISLGGSVYATSEKPEGNGKWSIGIQDPEDLSGTIDSVDIAGGAVVTSGDYQRYYEKDGVRYHHIIDPATLMPADAGYHSVTIVCDESAVGDALSTALFMMNKEEAEALLKKYNARVIYH